ncbi:MAG: J domain-containing protein, partial [Syntrophales bacterium]|nr:J domain-containing protein [Syntrophales bacterium]
MRESELYTSQLFNACHVLFGQDIDVSVHFLQYLQMPGLKAAFRKKALETHPDRAASLALEAIDLEEQFKQVNAAYKDLAVYLENPLKFRLIDDHSGRRPDIHKYRTHYRPKARPKSQDQTYEKKQTNFFFQGKIPEREFLFGRYLYYQKLISYKQLIDAIIWQKVQRPLIGHLALRWKWLLEHDVSELMNRRQLGERFGECALRCNYLTPHELNMLLGRQRILQPRIGKYFVEK